MSITDMVFGRGCLRAAAMMVLLAIAWPGSAGGREFRAADIQEENYPTVQALRYMDQLVSQRTNGAHRIRVFHSRQLGEESQTIEQTKVGAIDIDRINVGALGNVAPIVNALALPFLFRSTEHLYRVIDGPIGTDILNSLESYGFVGLTFYDSGARSLYTVRKPVQQLSDLAGMRIRVQQSDLMNKMIKALGATPVQLPFGQVLTALSTNLIDGRRMSPPTTIGSRAIIHRPSTRWAPKS
jgi:tripartite ATP-independent transporter DctP family solute receptor